jgi:phage terminase Nu1 subunit (DNA packaging protein)
MPQVSTAKLVELTGMAWRTVKGRLENAGLTPERERNADLYESTTALAALYAAPGDIAASLDLNTERARLVKWQADKTEQDIELRAGRMLAAEDVTAWVADMISTAKARLVQVPDAVAQHFEPETAQLVAEHVRRLIYEAMADLAAQGERKPRRTVVRLEAPAAADSLGMGG